MHFFPEGLYYCDASSNLNPVGDLYHAGVFLRERRWNDGRARSWWKNGRHGP